MKNAANINSASTLTDIMENARVSRRSFLGGAALLAGASALPAALRASGMTGVEKASSSLTFTEISKQLKDTHTIADGYTVQNVLRWGDPLLDQEPFDQHQVTAASQKRRFGYNNDYIAYLPITRSGSESHHGLLCVNHEYTNRALMFSGLTREQESEIVSIPQAQVEMEAHGCSVVEVKCQGGVWSYVPGSRFNRRITATTPMRFSGAAKGHRDLRTSADPKGLYPVGTIGNCAGGVTPWGTVLSAEENFDHHFAGEVISDSHKEAYERYGVGSESFYHWHHADDRFDYSKEPNEPNRFGWIVEYDPYRPDVMPVKRTSLGRFKHECASVTLNHDGRVVVYSGDDEAFEYVYRFVTKRRYDPENLEANRDLLDDGVLSVARFHEDGSVEWLPLIYGEGQLIPEHGFHSQADIAVYTRQAADLVGATPMDRPEDVEVNPVTGSLFLTLTKNPARVKPNVANPRPVNLFGHILELTPPQSDQGFNHAADRFVWNEFIYGGSPFKAAHRASYPAPLSEHGWLANPDNVAFDHQGRIWICTDGQEKSIQKNDGLYAADCSGGAKGLTRLFFTSPLGAEVTGPAFTPDSKTLFLAVQHPGEGSSFDNPKTRWPDFDVSMPPRPSVIAIRHKNGQVVGT